MTLRNLFIKLFLKIIKPVAYWADKIWYIKASTSTVKFRPAPAEYSEVFHKSFHSRDAKDAEYLFSRDKFERSTGVYQIENARLISVARKSKSGKFHPDARKVYVSDQYFRVLRIGFNRFKAIYNLIKFTTARSSSKKEININGQAALLGYHFTDCNNYFHFWADLIGDLWFIRQMGYADANIDYYLIPFANAKWQLNILSICGIPLHKVMVLSSLDSLRAKSLIVPDRAKGGKSNPTWLVKALREQSGWNRKEFKGGERVYISRLDATRRALKNEPAIIEYLKLAGFKIYTLSNLSVEQQQEIFYNAEVILAPHGAALTNIIWCRAGTRLIEIFPVAHGNPAFYDLAMMIGMDYCQIKASLIADADPLSAGIEIAFDDLVSVVQSL